jgi:hypothetical protein
MIVDSEMQSACEKSEYPHPQVASDWIVLDQAESVEE